VPVNNGVLAKISPKDSIGDFIRAIYAQNEPHLKGIAVADLEVIFVTHINLCMPFFAPIIIVFVCVVPPGLSPRHESK
jgi:hypothetical protein